jgi:hypothetical protein
MPSSRNLTNLASALIALLLLSFECAAQSTPGTLSFTLKPYPYRTLKAGTEQYLVVEGFENISVEKFVLPHRRETVTFDGSVSPVVHMRIIRESAPIKAHPFHCTEYRIERDSTMTPVHVSHFSERSKLYPAKDADVFDVRTERGGGITLLSFRIPLVRWDEAAQASRIIEQYELVFSQQSIRAVGSMSPDQVRNDVAALSAANAATENLKAYKGKRFAADEAAVKFHVDIDTMYIMDQNWFAAHSIPYSTLDPATVRITVKGVEVPLGSSGMEDGRFDANDYFYFYGTKNYGDPNYRRVVSGDTAMPQYYDLYTDSSACILTWGGTAGSRYVPSGMCTSVTADTLRWYLDLAHYEKWPELQFSGTNTTRQQFSAWTSEDTWLMYWLLQESSLDYSLCLKNVYPGISGRAFCKLASWYVQSNTPPPAHKIGIAFNGSPLLDSLSFNRNDQVLLQAEVQPEYFKSGANPLTIKSIKTGYSNQVIIIWCECDYPRSLLASGNYLDVPVRDKRMTGYRTMQIDGFSDTSIVALRLRTGANAVMAGTWQNMGTSWTLLLNDTLQLGDRYIFSSQQNMMQAPRASAMNNPGLRRTDNAAEYILVTTRQFQSAAGQYVDFIRSQYNITAKMVLIEDIYDEFSYGNFEPDAIKKFLDFAVTSWTSPKPRYLLLMGDANYNYRASNQLYMQNYVPSYGFPVGDGWFGQLDPLSVIPQLRIGRVPVRSEQDVLLYLNKHRDYVAAPYTDWNKRYIQFTGGKPASTQEFQELLNTNTRIINEIIKPAPIGGIVTYFYKTTNPQSDLGPYTGAQVREVLDKGAMIMTYLGHSGTQTWDNSIGDPTQIDNKVNRAPFITDFGCSTGKFAEPNIVCFAELFLLAANSQAIGYIGNSALGFTSLTNTLPILFMETILKDSIYEVGAAHQRAKEKLIQQYGDGEVNCICMHSSTLFCDPIIRFPIPAKPNLHIEKTWPSITEPVITEQTDSVHVVVPFANLGRVLSDSIEINVTDKNTDSTLSSRTVKRMMPMNNDTLFCVVPVRMVPGTRTLSITLDPDNRIEELTESDNEVEVQYTVLHGTIQALNIQSGQISNWPDSVTILNPMMMQKQSSIVTFEGDVNAVFSGPVRNEVSTGRVYTRVAAPTAPLSSGAAYWRVLFDHDNQSPAGPFRAFVGGVKTRWMQIDSASFAHGISINASYMNDGMRLVDRKINIRTIAAGYYDGNFCTIEVDGINVLPNSFGWMYNIAVFDSVSLDFKRKRQFWTYGRVSDADSLSAELKRVKPGEIVVVSTSDEPYLNKAHFADDLKLLGSRFIDSIFINDSWAMIGPYGAATGSFLETWKPKNSGKVVLDSTFIVPTKAGSIASEFAGPAYSWTSAAYEAEVPAGGSITVTVLGKHSNGSIDTLRSISASSTPVSLTDIDPVTYPYIGLCAKLTIGSNNQSPVLHSWRLDFTDLPELAMNNQSVYMTGDSVDQGGKAACTIGIANPGPSPAGPFSISVEIMDSKNNRSLLQTLNCAGLAPGAWYNSDIEIETAQLPGLNHLILTIDPANNVREQFENNNVFTVPFYVKGDTGRPSFDYTFDGLVPIDYDYVRPHPEVHVRLFDSGPLPVTEPENFVIYQDDTLLTKLRDPSIAVLPGTSGEKAVLVFSPWLANGTHTFKINVRDGSGNFADSSYRVLHVVVENESRVLNFYNYPNPFAKHTDFTFALSGTDTPEEMHIKIYTVAGRLIRDIALPRSMLRIGFNTIRWDGLDQDGDPLGNGVYFYKVTSKCNGNTETITGKLSVLQ